MNRSRHERLRLPPKPQFGVTWIVVGMFAGTFGGFVLEIVWRRAAVVMLAGAVAGALLGSVVEGARFWQDTRKFHRARRS